MEYIRTVALQDRIFATFYDPLTAGWEKRYGAKLRRTLLANAGGRVLEIGVGTGLSLPHYPPVDELVAADPSEPMLRRARRRAAEAGRDVTFVEAPAEHLPFEDDSFDTVVSMLVLCTVADQRRALQEIRGSCGRTAGSCSRSTSARKTQSTHAGRIGSRGSGESSPTAAIRIDAPSTRSSPRASTSAASSKASCRACRR